jgi:hypothetical protein
VAKLKIEVDATKEKIQIIENEEKNNNSIILFI